MAKICKEGLTFDDVLLIPQKSDVIPSEVDLSTKLSKNITLKIPLIYKFSMTLKMKRKLQRP